MKTKLTKEQIDKIKEELDRESYYGQGVYLAGVYGVKPSYIRKLKQRHFDKEFDIERRYV